MLNMLNLHLIYSGKRKIILLFSKHTKMASGTPNNILATECKLNNKKKKIKIFEFSPRFISFIAG